MRHRVPLVAVLAVAALAWALRLLTAADPILGSGAPQQIFSLLAAVATVVLVILVAGTAILDFGGSFFEAPATGLTRVIVYAALTFTATFVGLHWLGFNLNTVLTTSAIVTAVMGFAMRATLSSLIAGLALHADRALHVGDSVVVDGEPVEILSLNWRAALGRRVTGRAVVIPNGKIADTATEILHAGDSQRAEFFVRVPLDQPPQEICNLFRDAVYDLPLVDRERPVTIAPVEFDPYASFAKLRIRYWTRRFAERSDVEGEAVRRLWYILQRHALYFPRSAHLDIRLKGSRNILPAVSTWLARTQTQTVSDAQAQAVAAETRLLYYAPDECIIVPDWSEGRHFVLFDGVARHAAAFDPSGEVVDDAPAVHIRQLGPPAAIAWLADELAFHIGPYARYAVMRASASSSDYTQIGRAVAAEIGDGQARLRFLQSVLPREKRTSGPGTTVTVRRNATGALAAEPSLRANGQVIVLAIPDVVAAVGAPQLQPAAQA